MTNNSFIPSHFKDLAQRLEDNENELLGDCNCQYHECVTRTIIDRAYYAAFLHAREWIKNNHPECALKGDGRDHTDVRRYLEQKRRKPASDVLYELHKKRKRADYKTNIRIGKQYAKDVISMADNVIQFLQ